MNANPYDEITACDYDKNAFLWKTYLPLLSTEAFFDESLSLLDLGCGTGSLLLELSRKISRGFGIDQSAEMISVARKKARSLELKNAEFTVSDIRQVKSPVLYDIVTCVDGVLPYLAIRDQIGMIQIVNESLNNDGIAVLEFYPRFHVADETSASSASLPNLRSITSEMLNEPFKLEVKRFDNRNIDRYRIVYLDGSRSITVLKKEDHEALHEHFYIDKGKIREAVCENGMELVEELEPQKMESEVTWKKATGNGRAWTVVLRKKR